MRAVTITIFGILITYRFVPVAVEREMNNWQRLIQRPFHQHPIPPTRLTLTMNFWDWACPILATSTV